MREQIQIELEKLTDEHKQAMQQAEEWMRRRLFLEGGIAALSNLLEIAGQLKDKESIPLSMAKVS